MAALLPKKIPAISIIITLLSINVFEGDGLPRDSLDPLHELREEFRSTLSSGTVGPLLEQFAEDVQLPNVFLEGGKKAWGSDAEEKGEIFCSTCSVLFQEVVDMAYNGTSLDIVFNVSIDICVALNISSHMFCQNLIEIAKPQLTWILFNTNLTGNDICGVAFSGEDCRSDNPERSWEVVFPPIPKPPTSVPDIPADGPTIKVLHLADTHFDPYYLPGSNANCGERFYCCREESGPVLHQNDSAGYWGDYRQCDSPRWTLEALYTHILEEHPDISFIIWTGDLVPHNVWNTSEEDNLYIIREAVNMVKTFFPDIPVYPAIGNHEAHPVNAFPPPYLDNEFDISWLYDEIAALWQTWLPPEVAQSVMYAAYYVVDIFEDLRLLSVNTNYCYPSNWWLLYDSVDPGEVLTWMISELQRAEDDGVKTYIISHIPSGDDCHYTWSHEYNKIIARYEGVIAGIFYGHTHNDHVQMFFDPDDPQIATKVAFVAQSQTMYSNLNSGYKIYTIDGGRANATYTVLDHDNWYFDLDRANEEGFPTFELLYTAIEEYNMTSLSPESYLDLIIEMTEEGSPKFDLFFKNYVKAGRPRMEEGCEDRCKKRVLCRLLVADTSDRTVCDLLLLRLALKASLRNAL